MKPESKAELKGLVKGVLAAFLVIGIITAIGVVIATVVITDESITIDDNTVLVEGDFTTWTHKWTNTLPNGQIGFGDIGFYIDEKNEIICVSWKDTSSKARFGIFDLSDFGSVYTSASGSHYTQRYSDSVYRNTIDSGVAWHTYGGISRSIESYILLTRAGEQNFEVWRGGSSAVWSHDVTVDEAGALVYGGIISNSGKYILLWTHTEKFLLYEGS